MKTYATISAGIVTNTIVADSLETAEQITASQCVFVTPETGQPHIGLGYADGVFEQPSPVILDVPNID